MSKLTLRTGIILGVLGVLAIAYGPELQYRWGPEAGRGLLGTALLTMAYTLAYSALLPFAASFVGASLVMRHTQSVARAGEPALRRIEHD
ncbi:hypothetical protein ACX80W_04120 [Arthrobacter sp. TMN-37]